MKGSVVDEDTVLGRKVLECAEPLFNTHLVSTTACIYYYSQGWVGVKKAGKFAVLQQNQHGQQPRVSLLGARCFALHFLFENVTQIAWSRRGSMVCLSSQIAKMSVCLHVYRVTPTKGSIRVFVGARLTSLVWLRSC